MLYLAPKHKTTIMKTLFTCLSLLIALACQSQDIVIFNSGDTLECKIIGVNYAGIHTKSKQGKAVYEKDLVESYRNNNVWVQVAGPTAEKPLTSIDMKLREQMNVRQNFEKSLNGAGSWLITGVVVSTLMVGAALLIEDQNIGTPLLVAGGLFLPLSTIIAGSKLKSASRMHKELDLK